MRKKFVKLFSFLMIFCLSFLFVGCSGPGGSSFSDDLFEKLENGEITEDEFAEQMKENLDVPLYGTKLLYRSSSSNIGDMETDYQDYYSKFSLWLSYMLIGEYGLYYEYLVNIVNAPIENYQYAYDSIRYQISDVSKISKTQKFITGDNTIQEEIVDDSNFTTSVTANINNKWNWSFEINSVPKSYIKTDIDENQNYVEFINPNTVSNNITQIFYNYRNYDIEQFKTSYSRHYDNTIYIPYLTQMLINTETKSTSNENYQGDKNVAPGISELPTDTNGVLENIASFGNQSDLVKAIEYLLYCYSLNYQPNGITVNGEDVRIFGYNSVDDALKFIKDRFDKHGAYIGFSENNKKQLVKDILDIVIGENAQKSNVVN